MWSYVSKKSNFYWLWHVIDHTCGKVLVYVFGRRKDEVFLQLKALLEPFNISRFYTDDWGAYERHLEACMHKVGKRDTQKIENKHLNLRTRIKRLARKKFVFPRQFKCIKLSLDYSLIVMNLEFQSNLFSTDK